jgi:ATP-dependent Clp protease ATP-binding subunit ClpA
VENPLSAKILSGELKEGDTIRVDAGKDGLTFNGKTRKTAKTPKTTKKAGAAK